MLSICLPVYNFNIGPLVKELSRQAGDLDMPFEIIVIDDKSDDLYRIANVSACTNLIYIQLDKNIGRSRIRNLFINHAKYEYLLFLDCDSLVISPRFISDYLEAAGKHENAVICGGRIYPLKPPERSLRLRWKYGIRRESKSAAARNLSPHGSFMSNSFLISRNIFSVVNFDEGLSGYGHEDTLFGFDLKKKGIPVIHIDNPVLNGHLESNRQFLKNTEEGIINLISILKRRENDIDFINHVKLLKYASRIKKGIMRNTIKNVFIMSKPAIKLALTHGFVSLNLFDFYKLGTLLLLKEADRLQKQIILIE
jgi:GT2 family glycosyltransferase